MMAFKHAVLPLGFEASAVACGIKKSGRLDLALFYSQLPAKASCKFTTNKIEAAPIKVCKRYLRRNKIYRAIVANSGNANCFTGRRGLHDADNTAGCLSAALNIKKESVLVASTGIIGKYLPFDKIKRSIPFLVAGLSGKGIDYAKQAIMTTDTFAKEATVKFALGGKRITVCGVAKGAGMIAPNMATMLCFIMTDADIAQGALDRAVSICVDNSFNCLTVDGCMSTNDTVIVLANAAAGNVVIGGGEKFELFKSALNAVCLELAKMIARDGEGATKFIRISVKGAKGLTQARRAALAIANSNLVKSAFYGENPNFGRVAAAVGASGINIREEDLKIKLGPLAGREINIEVSLGRGKSCATVYTSDLTPQYVKINAEYS